MRIERGDGTPVGAVWATFTEDEAVLLYESLTFYFEIASEGPVRPGWHTHVGEGDSELTVAVEAAADQ